MRSVKLKISAIEDIDSSRLHLVARIAPDGKFCTKKYNANKIPQRGHIIDLGNYTEKSESVEVVLRTKVSAGKEIEIARTILPLSLIPDNSSLSDWFMLRQTATYGKPKPMLMTVTKGIPSAAAPVSLSYAVAITKTSPGSNLDEKIDFVKDLHIPESVFSYLSNSQMSEHQRMLDRESFPKYLEDRQEMPFLI